MPRKRKLRSAPNQKEIDFSRRGGQLRLLARLTEVFRQREALALRAVDELCFQGREVTLAEIGEHAGWKVTGVECRTARRAVKRLIDNSYLIVDERTYGAAKHRSYQIVWSNVAEAVSEGRVDSQPKSTGEDFCAGHRVRPRRTPSPAPRRTQSPPAPDTVSAVGDNNPQESQEVTAPSAITATLPLPPLWQTVKRRLIQFGVRYPEAPVEQAREQGCAPEVALALIDHAESKPGAWTPQALRRRLLNAFPDQDPADESLWPEKSGDYSEPMEFRPPEVYRREAPPEVQAEFDLREKVYGGILDGLPDQELRRLCRQSGPATLEIYRRRGVNENVRPMLLKELEREASGRREAAL